MRLALGGAGGLNDDDVIAYLGMLGFRPTNTASPSPKRTQSYFMMLRRPDGRLITAQAYTSSTFITEWRVRLAGENEVAPDTMRSQYSPFISSLEDIQKWVSEFLEAP